MKREFATIATEYGHAAVKICRHGEIEKIYPEYESAAVIAEKSGMPVGEAGAWIVQKYKEGNKKAKQIQKMLKNPSKFLATIQIGITLAGFLSSAFASDAFAGMLAPKLNELMPFISINVWQNISIVIITIILSFFTLVFGELVPKRLAMKYYEKISYATIGVIKAISVITAPFVKLLTWATNIVPIRFAAGKLIEGDEDVIARLHLEENEKELINNVFEFNDIIASEIMTHRTDMYAIEIEQDLYEILDEIDEYKYSRIPVYRDSIDNIEGILFLKDILKSVSMRKKIKIADIIREAYFVPETKPIDEIFKELQANKMQMAIVVDEYGGTAGVLTMEDILEELVGNIFDEYDDIEFEYKKLDEKARNDLEENNVFWDRFEGKTAEVSTKVNDTYLKAHSQTDGVLSYGRMVDLMLADFYSDVTAD